MYYFYWAIISIKVHKTHNELHKKLHTIDWQIISVMENDGIITLGKYVHV
jgi:hypothetical protein